MAAMITVEDGKLKVEESGRIEFYTLAQLEKTKIDFSKRRDQLNGDILNLDIWINQIGP